MRGGIIDVGPVAAEGQGPGRRVVAAVNGEPLWFESPDIEMASAPEAFASALLMPALHHRSRLRLSDALDPAWLENSGPLMSVLHEWWGYPEWPVEAPAAAGATAPGPAATALYFSAGADSFHVLLRGGERVDWLVSLQGFDFPLEDRARADAVDASLRAVATAVGARAAIVRTNARTHALVRDTPWERAHGGVLGGIAHLLGPVASRVLISSSPPGDKEIPWGEHWRIDPLWSSTRTQVVHAGRGGRRLDKLRAIAAEPVVREHLRVCWRNTTPTGNCSRCNKCLLAMMILAECGALEHSPVFDGRDELALRVSQLRVTPDRYHTFDELLAGGRLAPDVANEVRAFVRRSRHAVRPDVVFRRALLKRLRRIAGLPEG